LLTRHTSNNDDAEIWNTIVEKSYARHCAYCVENTVVQSSY